MTEPPAPSPMHTRTGTVVGVTAGKPGDKHMLPPPDISSGSTSDSTGPPPQKYGNFNMLPNRQVLGQSLITGFAANYPGPAPHSANQFRRVLWSEIKTLSDSVFTSIVASMFPDTRVNPVPYVTQDDFYLVNRYMLKARVDHVYSSFTGRRPTDRVPVPASSIIPMAIADAINSYGIYTIHRNSTTMVPQPEAPPQDPATSLARSVTHATLANYAKFVNGAYQCGVIRISQVSRAMEGTAMPLLSVRQASSMNTVATHDTEDVQVFGQFSEWTPADGMIAAIMANGFDGIVFPGCEKMYFSQAPIMCTSQLRTSFSTNA